jgi:RNA polymerase-binding transcription factor DksA
MVAFERRDLELIAHTLQARRAELLRQIQEVTGRVEDESYTVLAGEVANTGDAASADAMLEVERAAIDRDLAEVREIDAALARIESGHYGLCGDCGEVIDPVRVKALPMALRCTACQGKWEHAHAQGRPARL